MRFPVEEVAGPMYKVVYGRKVIAKDASKD